MSETVPVHFDSREAYDRCHPDRVKARQLAQGVLYTLMLELKDDHTASGRVVVELSSVPTFNTSPFEESAQLDVAFKNDDAHTMFHLPAIVRDNELYLPWTRLKLQNEGKVLEHGYFLETKDAVREVFEKPHATDLEGDKGTQTL